MENENMTESKIPNLGIKLMPHVILGIPIVREKSEGGVILPESAQDDNLPRIRIIDVGPGVESIKRGDIVHVAPMSGQVAILKIKNIKVIKIYFDEIIGVE